MPEKMPATGPEIPKPEQRKKQIEGEEYGEYSENVYKTVIDTMQELGMLGKVKKRKIRKYHQLPAEAVFIFKKLEEQGVDVNNAPEKLLKDALRRTFGLIEKEEEYDQDIINKIGKLETIRWRRAEELKNAESFHKIVQTLKEHAVPEKPKTRIEQQPRVEFMPKGEYHKKESLE